MITRLLALGLFTVLAGCAAPHPDVLSAPEPVVFEEAIVEKTADPCDTSGDGFGGTGCPTQ